MDRHETEDDSLERQEAEGGRAVQEERIVQQFRGLRIRDNEYLQQLVLLPGPQAAKLARVDKAVEDARKLYQGMIPEWIASKGWQTKPGYEKANLRSYLQGLFPGAEALFMDEMLRYDSVLLRRIQGPMDRTDTWPQLTLVQAITVALMTQPGRGSHQEELICWWEKRYPWLIHGQFHIAEGADSRTTFRQHVGAFLSRLISRGTIALDSIDSEIYPYFERKYVDSEFISLSWRLRSKQENKVLAEFYGNPRPSVTCPLPRLPLKLRTMINERYLTYPGVLHGYTEHDRLFYCIEAANPNWTNMSTRMVIYNGVSRMMYLVDPEQLHERFRTACSLWGPLASTQFFRQNIIAVGNKYTNSHRASRNRFFAQGTLIAMGELGRKNLGRVHLDLTFGCHVTLTKCFGERSSRYDIVRGLEYLGESEHLSELDLYLEFQGQALIDAQHQRFDRIPGFDYLRRFRGIRQLTIITKPSVLQVGIESWLRPRVTQLKLRSGPRTALQLMPRSPTRLMNTNNREVLEEMALNYGFDPNIDRLPNGGKATKDDLAYWLSEQLHKCCRDPDYMSESQWENRPKRIVFVRTENQNTNSGGAQSVLAIRQPRAKPLPRTTAPRPSLSGRFPSHQIEQFQAEENTGETSNQNLADSDKVDAIGTLGNFLCMKRKMPLGYEKGTGGKRPRTEFSGRVFRPMHDEHPILFRILVSR